MKEIRAHPSSEGREASRLSCLNLSSSRKRNLMTFQENENDTSQEQQLGQNKEQLAQYTLPRHTDYLSLLVPCCPAAGQWQGLDTYLSPRHNPFFPNFQDVFQEIIPLSSSSGLNGSKRTRGLTGAREAEVDSEVFPSSPTYSLCVGLELFLPG